ncbi:histone-lysine N-methyltransferase SETMAR-like [Oratosquilla oratoria]|uniref:histone-lysine N-methyltransferase SETMAR-like n=1 Tax=Oratosquilla oratoria TaxID=337810 RepID=UPI003F7768A6
MIKFMQWKGYSARQINCEIKDVYGDDCPSYDTVTRWKRNFQTGHMSLTDEPRTGQPPITDSAVTVRKVENLILEDRQRQTRRDLSMQMLTILEQDEENFFGRLVTMDEIWTYMYDPEPKEMNYFAKDQIITNAYYCTLLNKLRDALKKKRSGILTKGVRLLVDSASAHSSQAALVEARRFGYEILPHPPYSPGLGPNGLFLFPYMKNPLRDRGFNDTDDVI